MPTLTAPIEREPHSSHLAHEFAESRNGAPPAIAIPLSDPAAALEFCRHWAQLVSPLVYDEPQDVTPFIPCELSVPVCTIVYGAAVRLVSQFAG